MWAAVLDVRRHDKLICPKETVIFLFLFSSLSFSFRAVHGLLRPKDVDVRRNNCEMKLRAVITRRRVKNGSNMFLSSLTGCSARMFSVRRQGTDSEDARKLESFEI